MLVIRHLDCFLEGLQEGPWEVHLNSLWLSYSSVKWDKDIYLLNLFWGFSVAMSCPTLCGPINCSTAGFPFLHYFPEFAWTHVHWVSDTIHPSLLCHSLLLLPSIFPSIRVFSNESALCTRWPKYWSFSISPSSEYLGLISFKIDWFDLAVQGTLKSLLQHHNSKASIFWHSALFVVHLSRLYMTTGKTD